MYGFVAIIFTVLCFQKGNTISLVESVYGFEHDQLDDGFPYMPTFQVEPSDPTFARGYFLIDAAKHAGARCLDGTPPHYYHREGTGNGSKKWFLWQQGGAWCTSDASCAQRALGSLGSTKDDPLNISLGHGYFDTNSILNPLMYNWNAVSLRYCDGASLAGDVALPVRYKNQTLYYRGKAILEAEIKSLLHERGMKDATDIIIGGCSAGGLAAYLHCDTWSQAIKNVTQGRAKVRCMPDSGFFIDDVHKVHGRLIGTYRTQSCKTGVHQSCVAEHNQTGDDWKCMFAQWTAPYIQTPTFGLQSQYDSWQAGGFDNVTTNLMGTNLTALLKSNLLQLPQHGAFLDSCSHHCGNSGPQPAWGIPGKPGSKIDGESMGSAVKSWYDQGSQHLPNKGLYNQNHTYPCTECCTS